MRTLAAILALASLAACATDGKSPSQLRAERAERRAETPIPVSDNIRAALGDIEKERVEYFLETMTEAPQ